MSGQVLNVFFYMQLIQLCVYIYINLIDGMLYVMGVEIKDQYSCSSNTQVKPRCEDAKFEKN